MRRFVLAASLLTLSLAVTATPATAQGFIGGGVTTPMGDFGDAAKMGWAVNAGFRPWQSADKRMSLWAEGLFAQNNYKNNIDGKTTMMGGFGSITYNLTAEASAVPYVIGSAGYLSSKAEVAGVKFDAEGALGFGGGVGVGIKKFYLEGRYLTSSKDGNTTAFIMWTAGYTF
jgi:hypothetical protein